MKPKLFNLRLLVSLCNLNYLQISVKEKWLNREKQLLIHLLQSSFCYVLNFTVVKSNPKISIIYHEIKISERYTEQVFYKKAVLKNFAIFTEKHPRLSLFLNKNTSLQSWNYQKEALTQVLSCEYCETFKSTCFEQHLWTAVWTFSYMSKWHNEQHGN